MCVFVDEEEEVVEEKGAEDEATKDGEPHGRRHSGTVRLEPESSGDDTTLQRPAKRKNMSTESLDLRDRPSEFFIDKRR